VPTCSGSAQKRLEELRLEAQIAPLPPVIQGGFLVVPLGLIRAMQGRPSSEPGPVVDTQESAARARAIVMELERSLGYEPVDRESEKLGYDVESRVPGTGKLRFIEVKGRVSGAKSITVTRNEVLYSLTSPRTSSSPSSSFWTMGAIAFITFGGPSKRNPTSSSRALSMTSQAS
jgi:hypothetical protein